MGPSRMLLDEPVSLCAPGRALDEAVALAETIASHPQRCLRADRRSSNAQWSLDLDAALATELRGGLDVLSAPEFLDGGRRFTDGGEGRGASL